MAGNLGFKDKEMFKMMLILCQLRGEDSTGIFYVENGVADAVTHKVVGDPSNLFETNFWDKLNFYNKSIVVGHCRKATVGAVNKFTAHPFTFDHITGVHNGTLRNWRLLPGEALATDSMTLYRNFAQEEGVRGTIEQTDGAYALNWYDADTGTLNFLRNNERPLFYAFNEAGDCMYWASEAWMIYMCANRLGVKLQNLTPKDKFPSYTLEVDENKWWKVRCKNASKDALVFVQPPEDLKGDVKKPVKAVPFQQPRQGGYYESRYRSPFAWEEDQNNPRRSVIPPVTTQPAAASTTTGTSLVASSKPTSPSTPKATPSPRPTLCLVQSNKSDGSESSNSESQLNDPVPNLGNREEGEVFDNELKGAGALVFTKDEFQTLVDPNCIWCKTPYTFEELKGTAENPSVLGEWTDDDTFVCASCLKHINTMSCC